MKPAVPIGSISSDQAAPVHALRSRSSAFERSIVLPLSGRSAVTGSSMTMRARSRSSLAIQREASSVRMSSGTPTSVIARPAESANAVTANEKTAMPTGRPSTR